MCRVCDELSVQEHSGVRGMPPVAGAAAGFAAAGAGSGAQARARSHAGKPHATGAAGTRYVIRGGAVMSMDPSIGDFPQADVLVEGKTIVAIGPHLETGDAQEIDARGRIVMPGFIDTHHHQFETALRSFLADGLLFNDGKPHGAVNYFEYILGKFAPVYRPQDVHISTLFGSLSQLDAGVTTVHDISQIHHTPELSDASIAALVESGRRAAFGYFEGRAGSVAYPNDARRLARQYFASADQLVSMTMGGEIYLPGYEAAWAIGRELRIPIAAHIVGSFGMRAELDKLAAAGAIGPDNLFIHMTGMSDLAWQKTKDAGAAVSLSVPIEANMRHGMPPLLKALSLGILPSLSTDVECTLTADFFTQMRTTLALQRAMVNESALETGNPDDLPELLTTRDVLGFATLQGARDLKLDAKVGSLVPGKEADIIILDATAINVAPLNHVPGAVVSLMERSNVETVIVAGRIRKWGGQLLNVDLPGLRTQLEASRDYLFDAAGIPQDLFRTN